MTTYAASPTTARLIERSLAVLRSGQDPAGAFIASPDFPPYRFGWVRDGTFCAYALDRLGYHAEAGRFHRWVGQALTGFAASRVQRSGAITGDAFPPTRFTLDGRPAGDEWPNFQLDGYGIWLWGVAEHARMSGDASVWETLSGPVDQLCNQLEALWRHPCFDCWEEAPDRMHTSTLACVSAGLRVAGTATGRTAATRAADEIEAFIRGQAVHEGRFVKSVGSVAFDASLLWLSIPFALPTRSRDDTALAERTVGGIWAELGSPGVRRYDGDRYYGGGAWPLLTAWYGWSRAGAGLRDEAQRCLAWIETQAGPDGSLPEQVDGEARSPLAYEEWLRKWGPPARQLLWSHAMYLVLADELKSGGGRTNSRRTEGPASVGCSSSHPHRAAPGTLRDPIAEQKEGPNEKRANLR